MADALKLQYGPVIPRTIATMIRAVHGEFPAARFVDDVLDGYEPLALTARGWKIAHMLGRHLPADYPRALTILLASIEHQPAGFGGSGMGSFLYLPHTFFIATYGLDHFELSMRAQYELTQRFTAEFSIRAYLERHPEATLARLREWAGDPNEHVRRLVSEGTRPRLPWAPRLRKFQKDPRPVLALLELLKDDPSLYVRRSVANNLNDIGKDHPKLLIETAQRWLPGASEARRWLIRHALRSAVKRTDPGALAVLGFGRTAAVDVEDVAIAPKRPALGSKVRISCTLRNAGAKSQRVLADLRVHFVKTNGRTSPKVFKLTALTLGPRATATLRKTVSLADLTTRKHYMGEHRVELILNGRSQSLGAFRVVAS